jgi:hypothetical protein
MHNCMRKCALSSSSLLLVKISGSHILLLELMARPLYVICRFFPTPFTPAIAAAGAQLLQLLQQGLLVSTSAALQQLEAAGQAAAALDQQHQQQRQQQQTQDKPTFSASALQARRAALAKLHVAQNSLAAVLQHAPAAMVTATQSAIRAAGPVEVVRAQLDALCAAVRAAPGASGASRTLPGKQPTGATTTASGSTTTPVMVASQPFGSASALSTAIMSRGSSSSRPEEGVGCFPLQQVQEALCGMGLPPIQLLTAARGLAEAALNSWHEAGTGWERVTYRASAKPTCLAPLFAAAIDVKQGQALQQVRVLHQALQHLLHTPPHAPPPMGVTSSRSSQSSSSSSQCSRSTLIQCSRTSSAASPRPSSVQATLRLLLAGLVVAAKQQQLAQAVESGQAFTKQMLCHTEAAIVEHLQRAQLPLQALHTPLDAGMPRWGHWMFEQAYQKQTRVTPPWLQEQPQVVQGLSQEEARGYRRMLQMQPHFLAKQCLLGSLMASLGPAFGPVATQAVQLLQQLGRLVLPSAEDEGSAAGDPAGQHQAQHGQQGQVGSRRLLAATFSSWADCVQARVQQQLQQPWLINHAAEEMYGTTRRLLCEVELLLAAGELLQEPGAQGRVQQLQGAWQHLWAALSLLGPQIQGQQSQTDSGAGGEPSNSRSSRAGGDIDGRTRGGLSSSNSTSAKPATVQEMVTAAYKAFQPWSQDDLQAPGAVAQLLGQYHQQLLATEGAMLDALKARAPSGGHIPVHQGLLATFERLVLTRGRLEAALRGGGVSSAQRMRLLNLLGPPWWRLGGSSSMSGGTALDGEPSAGALWPRPERNAVDNAAAAGAGVGGGRSSFGMVPADPDEWLADLWESSNSGLLHAEPQGSSQQQQGAMGQETLWDVLHVSDDNMQDVHAKHVLHTTTSGRSSSSGRGLSTRDQALVVHCPPGTPLPSYQSHMLGSSPLACEDSSLGSSIPVPSVLYKGMRVQTGVQLAASVQRLPDMAVSEAGTVSLTHQHNASQLQAGKLLLKAMLRETQSGLWEVQRTAAAATALELLAAQGLLLPTWSRLGTAGAGLGSDQDSDSSDDASSSSSSSSSSGDSSGQAVHAEWGSSRTLPVFGVGPKSQQQLQQEQELTALVRGLPEKTLDKVGGEEQQRGTWRRG